MLKWVSKGIDVGSIRRKWVLMYFLYRCALSAMHLYGDIQLLYIMQFCFIYFLLCMFYQVSHWHAVIWTKHQSCYMLDSFNDWYGGGGEMNWSNKVCLLPGFERKLLVLSFIFLRCTSLGTIKKILDDKIWIKDTSLLLASMFAAMLWNFSPFNVTFEFWIFSCISQETTFPLPFSLRVMVFQLFLFFFSGQWWCFNKKLIVSQCD